MQSLIVFWFCCPEKVALVMTGTNFTLEWLNVIACVMFRCWSGSLFLFCFCICQYILVMKLLENLRRFPHFVLKKFGAIIHFHIFNYEAYVLILFSLNMFV
ncbi:hypothetical protein OIU79_005840 [Salix purpurea]|uniref:Uncharacterized protein n=1 Tax=Salix purpurea TaxID=77065 RepID=A0A9Q0Z1C7_SALPP|nr:hypothetical protein OIU79_005840 [Salix purpurea]